MKLSILIPTYNYDCSRLVAQLQQQAAGCGIACEIIVADDGSTLPSVRTALQAACLPDGCRLMALKKNVGRARVRNLLAEAASGDYLLFADSDALVCRPDFLRRYVEALEPGTVVCGGIVHPGRLPSPSVSLRYRYEKQCEKRFTAERRNRHPHAQLRSFNILLPRTIARRFPFDERITRYGYEDTLMGRALAQARIRVVHIDNPLMNNDLEPNPRFLDKTEEAIRTLCALGPQMQGYSSLMDLHQRLQRMGLAGCMRVAYRLTGAAMRRHLAGRRPCVGLFQCYKLLYLNATLEQMHQKNAR